MADERITTSECSRIPTSFTTPVNRRAILASLASAPVVALPAIAAPPPDDPVLIAVEMVRRAHDEWGKAADIFHEVDVLWMEEYEQRAPGYIVMKDGFKARTPERIVAWHREHDPVRKYEFKKRIFEALDQQMPTASSDPRDPPAPPTPAEVRAYKLRMRRDAKRLADALAERQRLKDESGFTAAKTAFDARTDEVNAYEADVLSAEPMTVAGAAALARYCHWYVERDFGEPGDVLPALINLEAFLLKGTYTSVGGSNERE